MLHCCIYQERKASPIFRIYTLPISSDKLAEYSHKVLFFRNVTHDVIFHVYVPSDSTGRISHTTNMRYMKKALCGNKELSNILF